MMMLDRFISLFCVIIYITFIDADQELQKPGPSITTNMYALDIDNNVGYEKKSIVQQLEDVSRVQCFLQCNKIEGCHHVVVSEAGTWCKLLGELESLNGMNPEDKREDGEKIFSLVGESLSG